MNNNLLWVLLLVVLAVLAIGVLLSAPQCARFPSGVACETVRYIPGIALGVPGEQVGFETIEFRSVAITAQANVVQATVDWLQAQSYRSNTLVHVRAKADNAGAFAVCLAPGLKAFASQILPRLGLASQPQRTLTIHTLECYLFFASAAP